MGGGGGGARMGGGGGGAHFGGYGGGGGRPGDFDGGGMRGGFDGGGRPGGFDGGGMRDGGFRDGGFADRGIADGGMRDGGFRDEGVVRDGGAIRDGGIRDGGVGRDGAIRDGAIRDGAIRDGAIRDGGVGRDVGPGHFAGEGAFSRSQLDNLRDRGIGDRGIADRGIRPYSINTLENRGTMIRNNFYHGGWYGGRGWYGNHFGPWWPGAWWGGFGVGVGVGMLAGWGGTGWGGGIGYAPLCTWGGYGQAPVVYNYGSTICYQDDGVYVSGDRVGTAAGYAAQAATLADQGNANVKIAADDQWRPLGVFALAREEETTPSTFLSLAIDQAGILRGTYYDAVSDTQQNITGKVDKQTQRAAWTIGDKKTPIYETGLVNLTQQQTTVLVHRDTGNDGGTGKVEQMLLVRVPDQGNEPAGKDGAAEATKPPRPVIGRPAADPAPEPLSVPSDDGNGN